MAKRVFSSKDFTVVIEDVVLFQRQGDRNLNILFRGTTKSYCVYFENSEDRDFAYSRLQEEMIK